MRFSAVAFAGLAAIAYAQEAAPDAAVAASPVAPDATVEGGEVLADDADADVLAVNPNEFFSEQFSFAPGILGAPRKDLPHGPPAFKGKGKPLIWHPPHKGIFIDDCDDDKDDKWHWAHKGKKHPKPIVPHHKWTTSTVTATKTKTVFDCGPHVPHCPGDSKTKYTTTTVVVTTTVCPVPIKKGPHPPKPPKGHPHPPKPTKPSPPSPPPAVTPGPPAPEVPEVSAPPVVVSAGTAQNAAGALAVVAALVAALI